MVYKVIGTMSGSSLDGLDVVFVEVEEKGGNWSFQVLEADCLPFENDLKEQLKNAPTLTARELASLDARFGSYIGEQVNQFIEKNAIQYKVALVASHGHTVFHHPPHYTTQIGNGAFIAAVTSLPVVSDLRTMDVAMGGQGAPIVPMGEQLLFPQYKYFLNIGGIANISYNGASVYDAFDVCPANRVLNTLAEEMGFAFDEQGTNARKGNIVEGLLDQLNAQEYYWQTFPKSLANEFGTEVILPLIKSCKLDPRDALCTYVEHIAMQVRESIQQINRKRGVVGKDDKMLVTGGGAFNQFLIERLNIHLNPLHFMVEIPDAQTVAYKEAIIMGLLGILRWREEPTVLKTVTGAREHSIGGALWMGKS
ncbi:MAG: anhydro-N-acetylmuramic acid kinase [Bacteroidetes bacterium]|nr:anhydro-N-acetylmuramic acid kinase [Bacteroidota bacterium]